MSMVKLNELLTDSDFNELLDVAITYSKKHPVPCLILCFKTSVSSELERVVADLRNVSFATVPELKAVGRQVAKDITLRDDGDYWGGLVAVMLISKGLHAQERKGVKAWSKPKSVTMFSGMTMDKKRTNLAIMNEKRELTMYVPYKENRKKYVEKENSLSEFIDSYIEEIVKIFIKKTVS